MKLWPRSLAGQMALLIALALFAAQSINFATILHERGRLRLEQLTGPAVVRFSDATERLEQGRSIASDRGRVRLQARNPVPAGAPREADIERQLATALTGAGLRVEAVVAAVRPINPADPQWRRFKRWRGDRLLAFDEVLTIAVRRPGGAWLVQSVPWPRNTGTIVWRLAAQTLVLYAMVLLPVLWAARRMTRPLRRLTDAAERFGPGEPGAALPVSGPADVAALIAAFNALRLRVTAMLDEKDRMLGALGHDLRTPLAALRVRIESVDDEHDRARMADTIGEMNRTLDDILSLARVGRPSEPPTEVDLAALVDAVVEDFRDLGQDVTFTDAPRLPMRLRSGLMRRAVRNLIENAVKYGGRAEVSIAVNSDRATVTVADGGPGIPPDRLDAVFDPFTRLEGSRNRDTGGIGLGLALARSIVHDAGGDVLLRNRPGGGLEATITLPR